MVTKIMQIEEKISCILCGSTQNKVSFPYSIKFSESEFFYKRCSSCKCVFVNPIPSDDDFEKIYQNDNYHEEHYVEVDLSEYEASVGLLSKYISNDDAKVLDYGCGYGHFLKALQKNKFLSLFSFLLHIHFDCQIYSHFDLMLQSLNILVAM